MENRPLSGHPKHFIITVCTARGQTGILIAENAGNFDCRVTGTPKPTSRNYCNS